MKTIAFNIESIQKFDVDMTASYIWYTLDEPKTIELLCLESEVLTEYLWLRHELNVWKPNSENNTIELTQETIQVLEEILASFNIS
jgi:hypothetical protein